MTKIKKGEWVLLLSKEHSYLLKADGKMHTSDGIVELKDCKEFGTYVKTHKDFEFAVVKPNINDLLNKKMKRMPASIHKKDLGFIIGVTGLQKDWKVLEAGTGSGHATLFFAEHCTKVISYEVREDFHKHVKDNLELLNIKNVELRNKDIKEGIKEKDFDLILLDMKGSEEIIEIATKALKPGGFIVIYSPYIEQSKLAVEKLTELDFNGIETSETILRTWDVRDHTLPKRAGMMHTAFITIARKV